jgi:MYXO-CTERM domain-containing protein
MRLLALLIALAHAGAAQAQDLRTSLRALLEEEPAIRLRELRIGERSVTIGIELPDRVPLDDLPPEVENRFEIAVGAISASRPAIDSIHLLVAHPNQRLRPPPSRPPLARSKVVRSIVRDPSKFPFGQALLGKTIALSPGHGWLYSDALGRYATQRGNIRWTGCGDCRGITEDFETHEVVIRHLIPLLEGAGARVVLVRERDYAESASITDDGDAGYAEVNGTYAAGVSEGGHANDYRTTFDPGGTVEWTIPAAEPGEQLLSLWFVPGANRLADARLEVVSPGGRHEYLVDLTSHGRRWAPIDLFDLKSGDTITARMMSPLTAAGDRALIADAVRLGAGKHTSDHPWWQMSAADFAAHQSAPAAVLAFGDVTIRPRYAEFYGADIYVAVHSNASGQPDSTAAGTSTYRYNCGVYPDHSNDPPPADCDDPVGSDRLQALVHGYLVDQVRADWDADWTDRGTKVANFGELRELDGIPGVLIESAFHDNVRLAAGSALSVTDNQALHDPRWRRAAAFGIYRGISEYLAGPGPLVAPPPSALAVERIDRSSVRLTFEAVADALGYRVYVAAGGRTFDQGRIVQTSSVVIDGLADTTVAVRVASLNAAGEGRKSSVAAARSSARPAQVLIVDAFQREDAWVQDADNRGDTALAYSLAAASTQYAFDGANEAALTGGLIDFTGYDAIVLALGRESTEHGVLTPELRDRLLLFVENGGAVFASGSEVAYALDAAGDDTSRAFLETVFGALLASDDAGAAAISGMAGGWLESVSSPLSSASAAAHLESRSPDVLAPSGGAVELIYQGTDAAAVRKDKSLLLGIALDSVADPIAREQILGAWLTNAVVLAPEEMLPPVDGGVVADGGTVEADGGEIIPKDAGVVVEEDAGMEEMTETPPLDEAPRAVAGHPVTGGCGCRSSAAPSSVAAMLLLLGVTALVARRR